MSDIATKLTVPDYDLQQLTLRWAAMIGIVQPDGAFSTAQQVVSDRAMLGFETDDESDCPIFNMDRCAAWMAEQSGEPLLRCRKILFAEWGDAEDQEFA